MGFLNFILNGYSRGLRWVLRHQIFITLFYCMALLTFCFHRGALPDRRAEKGFCAPQQDSGTLRGVTEAAQDISFPAMAKLQSEVARIILNDTNVATVGSFIGGNAGSSTVNNGQMFAITA